MARRNRFVTPEIVRLELSDGDWIEVKKRLTFGEQEALTAASLRGGAFAGSDSQPQVGVDFANYKIERLVMYLADWSFAVEGQDGAIIPVPLTRSAIATLDPATADEITAALDAHVAAQAVAAADPTPASAGPSTSA